MENSRYALNVSLIESYNEFRVQPQAATESLFGRPDASLLPANRGPDIIYPGQHRSSHVHC